MKPDLAAIRARDAACIEENEYGLAWIDRRALLAYVDELREAAWKVTCWQCCGRGYNWGSDALHPFVTVPCPDCSDLRRLLEDSHE